MSIQTVTHLNFRNAAREALGFYQSVFEGEIAIATYADAHAVTDPAEADLVIWGQVVSEAGFAIMAFDVPSAREFARGSESFFVSVRGNDESEIRRYWEALIEGGTIIAPLAASGWSPLYGMVADRFGITWVLDIAPAY